MYWHMSGVPEVTACSNQQRKKKKIKDSGWQKHIVGVFMRPQSSRRVRRPRRCVSCSDSVPPTMGM